VSAVTRDLPQDEDPDDRQFIGSRIDRFEVHRVIGRGGMGVVVEAHDPLLDRRVALKLVDRQPVSPRAGARLVLEARAMARLAHPNVVTVYEVGEVEGRVFLVMELVSGRTLAEWLDEDPPRDQILAVFRAAGAGVAAAHEAGIVHRDFKPSNVMIGDDRRVRVTDFGIARPAPGDRRAGDVRATTRNGKASGTPRYMAPEQRRGLEVTARADQFSFCVALWEALCGEHPFAEEDAEEDDAAVAPPVAAARSASPRTPRPCLLPPRIEAALRRGLSPDPAARWPSMASLLAALAPRRRPRSWLAALALIAAGMLVKGLFLCQLAQTSCARLTGARTAALGSQARMGEASHLPAAP
jgi:serine/threonine protein kinase